MSDAGKIKEGQVLYSPGPLPERPLFGTTVQVYRCKNEECNATYTLPMRFDIDEIDVNCVCGYVNVHLRTNEFKQS